jgi:hypothetical protein
VPLRTSAPHYRLRPGKTQPPPPSGVRLAELAGTLSLATDLGLGQPQEHVLRQTVLARRLAAAAGLSAHQQDLAGYVSLLAWVGCIADSQELAGGSVTTCACGLTAIKSTKPGCQ